MTYPAVGRRSFVLARRHGSHRFCRFGAIGAIGPAPAAPIAAPVLYASRRWQAIGPSAVTDLDRLVKSGEGDLAGFVLSDPRAHWIGYAEHLVRGLG